MKITMSRPRPIKGWKNRRNSKNTPTPPVVNTPARNRDLTGLLDEWAYATIGAVYDHGATLTNPVLLELTRTQFDILLDFDHEFVSWMASNYGWGWKAPVNNRRYAHIIPAVDVDVNQLEADSSCVLWVQDMPVGIEMSFSEKTTARRRFHYLHVLRRYDLAHPKATPLTVAVDHRPKAASA